MRPWTSPRRRHTLRRVSEEIVLCRRCAGRVDPADPATVYGVRMIEVPGFGQEHDWIDGPAASFHQWCSLEDVRYQRRERPTGLVGSAAPPQLGGAATGRSA